MSEPSSSPAAEQGASAQHQVGVQLVPSGPSEQAVFANLTQVHPAAAVALIDFGLLDPAAIHAVSRLAKSGKKMPERLNGRLAARVALSYDALANLHRQIGGVLRAVAEGAKAAREQGTRTPADGE